MMEYQKLLVGEEPYFIAHVKASYPNHCHNEIEIIYCTQGQVAVTVEKQEFILRAGCALFVDSLSMHQLVIEDDAGILDIEFGAQFLGSDYFEFAQHNFTVPLLTPDDSSSYALPLLSLLERTFYEYTHADAASRWVIRGYLNQLFATMVRYLPRSQEKNLQRQKQIDRYMRVQEVFDYVKSNYGSNITVEQVSAMIGYNPNAFCRMFKDITNMSFHQYLNNHRVNIALQLLENKSYSVSEVGELVGIPIPKSFIRVFRGHTGMSPREYRRRLLD